MPNLEVILILLLAVAALAIVARRFGQPYPITLVIGGALLGFVPGLPRIVLAPDLVFLIFLPPLLYADAWTTSWRDFRADLRNIGVLSIGLVIATTLVVAVAAHAIIPGLSWAAAFVLGAVVSPTDAVAANAIAQRVRLPRRIITIVDGESLVNDATGLVTLRFAVAAVVSGAFSLAAAGLEFVIVCVGGVVIGLAVGWAITKLENVLDDTPVEITVSFLAPFAAYITGEALGVSGVLAVVAAGLYAGRHSSRVFSPASRLQAEVVWSVITFMMNGLLFILVGLQLRSLLDPTPGGSLGTLLGYGALVSLTVIIVRLLWVFPGAYLPRFLFPSIRKTDPYPSWRRLVIVGWMGMRGALSLAAALSLPIALESGKPFAERPLIIFLTFCVILSTLVLQGFSLPSVARWLGVGEDDSFEREEQIARLETARAAMARLDELENEDWVESESIAYMRSLHEHRGHRYDDDGDQEEAERDRASDGAMRRLKREVLEAERAALIRLRDTNGIGDDVLRRIQRELDLQETWLQS
jgi:monovalent cation/hydrogen antiporter